MSEARTFDALRGKPHAPNIDDKILRAAVGKIARTAEGAVFFAWLRNRVNRALPPDASDGALRDLNGAKRLADEIEALASTRDEGRLRNKR